MGAIWSQTRRERSFHRQFACPTIACSRPVCFYINEIADHRGRSVRCETHRPCPLWVNRVVSSALRPYWGHGLNSVEGCDVQFVSMLRTLSLNPEELEKLSIAYEDALRALPLSDEPVPSQRSSQRSSPNGSSKPPKQACGIRQNFARW